MISLDGWSAQHSQERFFVLTKGTLKIEVQVNYGHRSVGFICTSYKNGVLVGSYGSLEYAVASLEE